MNAREELVSRLTIKRRRQLSGLSDAAAHELELAVADDPSSFVEDSSDQAFLMFGRALDKYVASQKDDDLLDDDQYAATRERRMAALSAACEGVLAEDPDCLDARLTQVLVRDLDPDPLLDELLALDASVEGEHGRLQIPVTGDAWSDVFLRPRIRLTAAISRACLDGGRYRMAMSHCTDLLASAPLDAIGARYTCALAMARLEDEDGLEWLDARFGRRGNAWMHLARTVLMYKLGRIPAARRALRGFDRLCEGGSYTILQPAYVDVYVPDRPSFEPGTFAETALAAHEADPVICDIPDFANWVGSQPDMLASAQAFAERNGFDWRGYDE